MEFKLKLPIAQKTKYLIQMLNPVMGNLTDKEIDILVVIADKNISIINKDTRTDVRMTLNMDKFNFNNYIKKLVTKKVLQQVDRLTLKVNPNILHILKHDSVNLSFI
jgi:DNA-binding MarR family transcriptional regulator